MNYYNLSEKEVYEKVDSSREGLSSKEASKRLLRDGKNELPKKKKDSIFKILLGELLDPMVILLIVVIFASLFTGEVVDACVIAFIVVVDLIIGTIEENKANTNAESLQKLVTIKTKVLRDGREILIDATEVVIGDIVILESGDKISADLRVLEAHNLTIDEAILTGESVQVEKHSNVIKNTKLSLGDQKNMLFAGTNVVTGRGVAVVIGTALNTEIGKIANTLNETKEEKSPLTIRVEKFTKQITMLLIVIAIIIAVVLVLKKVPYNEIFLSVIALSVSAMPEGLPLALTMALTIGSNRMAKKKVIAKKLYSVESLGSCTVIASDKTGTLTCNEQTAKKILLSDDTEYEVTGIGYSSEGRVIGDDLKRAKDIALLGVLNNEAILSEKIGDSIDLAFLVLGEKLKVKKDDIKIIDSIPYESSNKYSAVFYEEKGKVYCTIKGSLEKVTSFCKIKEKDLNKYEEQNERLATDGYRVITLAHGEIEKKKEYKESDIKNLSFDGMVGFIDPIRKEVVASIRQCSKAGIKVIMITGDHPLTAFKIGKDLSLTNDYIEVTTGEEVSNIFEKGNMEKFDAFVKSKKIFSRVDPIQKLQIVESLKRQGEFVAVTGDGVNDAPALKTANIGVAMGSGTDIAKETAKMIVIDDNFKSIVAGVKEGRIAYSNIRKIAYFLVSSGIAEISFYLLSVIFNLPLPLLAIQLLWLNLVTDGLQDIALSFEKGEKTIMEEKPRDTKESLFDKVFISEILFSGIVIGLVVFGLWAVLIKEFNMDETLARGFVMTLMVFIQNVHVFNCRSEKNSAFSVSISSNPLIIFTVFGSILLQFFVMEIPFLRNVLEVGSIGNINLFLMFLLSLIILVVMEIYKSIRFGNKEQ